MKRTIEIEDGLSDIVENTIEEVKNELLSYLEENADKEDPETPCISNDLDYSGAIHEIIDGSVPIYTQEITDIMYLHGSEVEDAFDDAGFGSKEDKDWPMGWKAAAVYCYIEQKVHEWYSDNADSIVEEWAN